MGEGDTLLNAAVGAAVTVVLSFTGVSPVIGGGVAGYLQRESRTRGAAVGALSGVLAFVPFLFVLALAFAFLVAGQLVRGVPGGVELLVFLLLALPFVLLWNASLGAVGGYLGTYVREETAS